RRSRKNAKGEASPARREARKPPKGDRGFCKREGVRRRRTPWVGCPPQRYSEPQEAHRAHREAGSVPEAFLEGRLLRRPFGGWGPVPAESPNSRPEGASAGSKRPPRL